MTAAHLSSRKFRAGRPPAAPCRGRNFPELPGRAAARALLARINDGVCRSAPRHPRAPLALYGAGDLGRLAFDHLRTVGVDVALVVDRDAARLRSDPFWAGVRLVEPTEVTAEIKETAQLAVCIATAPFCAIGDHLAAEGWSDIVPFYDLAESQRHRHPLSNGWFAEPLPAEEMQSTAAVLDGWDDDLSRAHHLQFLAWRRLREEWTFDGAPVTGDNRFFIPEVEPHLEGVRVFVDGGAHRGGVIERFVAKAGTDLAAIVAFEPDENHFEAFGRMQSQLSPGIAARVRLEPHALDAVERRRTFHDGLGYASQFSETGSRILTSRTLDSFGLLPDFVKLHLEGGELDALRGGLETIRASRPVLAVTTYHNADGIWRTPAWLMEHLDDYRFLMRLHSWCGTGAVVYAIPREPKVSP